MKKLKREYLLLIEDEYPIIIQPTIAKLFGEIEAILLQQIHYWLCKTKHYHDDKYWVYNSCKDWAKQFPNLTERKIYYSLGKLKDKGILITANYNKLAIDRTTWYSINYEELKNRINNNVKSGNYKDIRINKIVKLGNDKIITSTIIAKPSDKFVQSSNEVGKAIPGYNNIQDNTSVDNKRNEIASFTLHPLNVWVKETCPNVAKMKTQMTNEQCNKIITEFGEELVKEILDAMDNKKYVVDKYISVNKTLRSWIHKKKEWENNGGQKEHQKGAINKEKYAVELNSIRWKE